METRIIHCNTRNVLYLTLQEKSNGLEMILVDAKNIPIARYGFDMEKLKGVHSISYHSNSIRIHFDGIKPTSLSELDTVVE